MSNARARASHYCATGPSARDLALAMSPAIGPAIVRQNSPALCSAGFRGDWFWTDESHGHIIKATV